MAVCPSCSSQVNDGARFCPNCGGTVPTVQAEDADPLLGRVIARNFRVESLLGTGGMGRVYKARQISLDKPIVLKVLHPHFQNDPQLVQRFQREARAASRLNHPNSISIIDFGQAEDGTLFMAMELLHGQDLFNLLQREFPLAEDRLARIMVQVCSALEEAHEQNIIHRDLKPENIMVEDRRDQKDFVKVLDFGIAKIQDPGEGADGRALTQQGMVCGTPEYMSPEQARGEVLDARSDVYALGVLMYQVVTGDLPFKAESALGIVTKHITEPPVPPSVVRPDLRITPDVERIILKCMEKRADRRFQSAAELGQAWKDWLEQRAREKTIASVASSTSAPVRTGTLAMGAAAPSSARNDVPTPARVSGGAPVGDVNTRTEAAMDSLPAPPPAPAPRSTQGSTAAAPTSSAADQDLALPSPSRAPLLVGGVGVALLLAAGGVFLSRGSTPATTTVAAVNTPPVEPKPVETKPAEAKPVEAKPVEAKPVEAKPVETKPTEAKPTEAKPVETKPTEAKPAETKPAETKPAETKPAETKSAETKPTDGQPAMAAGKPGKLVAKNDTLNRVPAGVVAAAPDDDGQGEAIKELLLRANRRMSSGDMDEAGKALDQAVKMAPRNPDVLYAQGTYLVAQSDTAGACRAYKEALKAAPNHAKAKSARVAVQGLCN